jgi:Outer membrane protein beta-barrel domain
MFKTNEPTTRKKIGLKKTGRGLLAAAALLVVAAGARAQPPVDERPFEVGGLITIIDMRALDQTITTPGGVIFANSPESATVGFGGRVGYNLNRHVALEAEASFMPERNLEEVNQSRRGQLFAGVKAGKRWESFGVFAKARPGLMHTSNVPSHQVCGVGGTLGCTETSQTNFAMDIGGVVEFYPTPRTIVRLDVGDTIIRHGELGPTVGFNSSVFTPAQTTHNTQVTFGVGFRF